MAEPKTKKQARDEDTPSLALAGIESDHEFRWGPGLTHAKRKRVIVAATQVSIVAAVSAIAFLAAYLMLNGWPPSMGRVRTSATSVLPVLTGFIRLVAAPEFRPYLPLTLIAPFIFIAVFRNLNIFGWRPNAIVPFARTSRVIRGVILSIALLIPVGLSTISALTTHSAAYTALYFTYAGAIAALGTLLTLPGLDIAFLTLRLYNYGLTRLAIIASKSQSDKLAAVAFRPSSDYILIGTIAPEVDESLSSDAVPCLGSVDDLDEVINANNLDEIVLALDPSELAADQRLHIAHTCWKLGAELKMIAPFYPYFHTSATADSLGDTPLLAVNRMGLYANWSQVIKRLFDIVVSLAILIVISPFLLLVAILIRLDSPGPALFAQDRPGLHGRVFKIWKFRSMRTDADHTAHMEAQRKLIKEGIAAEFDEDGKPIYGKVGDDDRITRLGHFIRRTSIDELPQLFNVLRGEMSLVGPRPSVLYELENYSERHMRRLHIRPGMTGLWQVSGRSRLTFEQMVDLDLKYIENWSLWQDFKIMFRTIPVVLGKDEAF